MKQNASNNQIKLSPLKGSEAVRYLEETLTFPIEVLKRFPKYFLIEPINMCNVAITIFVVTSNKFGIITETNIFHGTEIKTKSKAFILL